MARRRLGHGPDSSIRAARAGDAAAIAGVYIDAWQSTYAGLIPDEVLVSMSRDRQTVRWARDLARTKGRQTILVSVDAADRVIGFGSCGPARDAAAPRSGEVYTLYVDPDHHGAGVGRALLEALFEALAGAGMSSAVVWVLSLNPSRFFYEAMGGKRFAERDEQLWGTVLRETGYAWSRPDVTKR